MPGYTKLFSSIVHSTIWRSENHVRLVWITMLAITDRRGRVEASLPGLADISRVSLEECQDALVKLASPDQYSRTKDFEGRRIEECEGGWILLNHPKYRDLLNSEERKEQVREAVQRHRERQKSGNHNVIISNQSVINVSHGKPPSSHTDTTPSPTPAPEADITTGGTTFVGLPPDGGPGTAVELSVTYPNGKPRKFEEIKAHLATVLAEVQSGRLTKLKADEMRTVQAEVVFAYWQAKCGHEKSFLDDKRLNKLKKCLQDNGGNVHELLYAIDGQAKDPILQRLKNEGKGDYDAIDNIFKDRERIERLAGHIKGHRNSESHPTAIKYLEGLTL